jgi:cupin 2 domain-containing protein
MKQGNIFSGLPVGGAVAESFDVLVERPGFRVERIVSTGQASPPDFWYDQPEDEWVVLLSGAAGLYFESAAEVRDLKPGDWLHIPAHMKHRVEWTDATQPSVWLAVHFDP